MMRRLTEIPAAVQALYMAHELLGLFLFLLIEEAGLPLIVPGDTLIIAAGAQPERTLVSALQVILTAAAAATIGSSVLYAIVRRGGQPLLARYGRFLHLHAERIAWLEGWFRRHGPVAIVVGRLIPGLRTPTSVMAGLFGVPYRTFAPATALAAVLWALFYFVLGVVLGREWHAVFASLHYALRPLVLVVLVVLFASLGGLGWSWRAWRRRRASGTE